LLRSVGAEVAAVSCIIELTFLAGREKLDLPVHALIGYDS